MGMHVEHAEPRAINVTSSRGRHADNFAEVFVISSPEPLLDLKPVRTAASEGTA
jgi:hypothetical protein